MNAALAVVRVSRTVTLTNSKPAVQVCDPQHYCWGSAQGTMIVVLQLATRAAVREIRQLEM